MEHTKINEKSTGNPKRYKEDDMDQETNQDKKYYKRN